MNARQLAAEIVTLFSECRYKESMKPLDWLQWRITEELSKRDDAIFNFRQQQNQSQGEALERDLTQ